MARNPISPTTMMATHIVREKIRTQGNIFVIALSFILILLVLAGCQSSSTMKGPIAINNPDQILAGSSLHLIYIDAYNCPYCTKFSAEELPGFKKTEIASKIYFTIINVADFRNPGALHAWPDYLKWVPVKFDAELRSCGPQFIAMKGRELLGTYCHSNGFWGAIQLLKSHANS